MRFAVLTRSGSAYGIRLLEALRAAGFAPAAIGVEEVTWATRLSMARLLARRTGIVNAVWYNSIFWTRVLRDRLRRTKSVDYRAWCDNVKALPLINCDEMLEFLRGAGLDLIVLGQSGIIRKPILDLPRLGTINAHPGPLPQYRGVDVVRWTLWSGGKPGVTLHYVDRGIDTGDVIEVRDLDEGPSIEEMEARGASIGIELLVEAVRRFAAGERPAGVPQKKEEGRQYYLMPPWTAWRLSRRLAGARRGSRAAAAPESLAGN